jgi:hypothetical protein
MSKLTSTTLGLSLAAALAAPAWGFGIFGDNAPTGAHYRNGSGEPVCTTDGLKISCTGTKIAGVGNVDADVRLTVTYSATVKCRNNGGQIVEVKTQTKTTTPAPDELTQVRNGTLTVDPFILQSSPSNQTFLDLATCPNPNWDKELFGTPTITSYTYTLTFQGYPAPAITVTGP